MTDRDGRDASAPDESEFVLDQFLNEETGTYYFPIFLIDAIIDPLSPSSKKLWLTDAYCRHWIGVGQVEFYFDFYELELI